MTVRQVCIQYQHLYPFNRTKIKRAYGDISKFLKKFDREIKSATDYKKVIKEQPNLRAFIKAVKDL